MSPYSAHIFLNRGNLYASLGQHERAENDYTRGMFFITLISLPKSLFKFFSRNFPALKLKPGDALTYKRRADVRGKLSKRDEAIEDYKMAIVIQTSRKKK
jgi:tetratricopeptide (TPR) repeat protein